MLDTLTGEGSIDETASYEPELLDWIMPSQLGKRSLCFFESEDFPKPKRAQIESLGGLTLTDEHSSGGWLYSPTWDLQFTYRGYRFSVESNSHAALAYFFVSDPSCPKAILLKVVEHFLGPPQTEIASPPPTPRSWRDELKDIGCVVILVAFLVGFCLLLIAIQQ